jgi:hypothetical protein
MWLWVKSFCSSLGLELVNEEKRREERSITLEEENLVLRL